MFFFDSNVNNEAIRARSIEHAYLAILDDDLVTAEAVFETIDSPRAQWGKALVGILAGNIQYYPTYFEIRNFYEIDLDFIIKNQKFDYIEMILNSLETLSTFNQEIYKYTARVMYENKMYNSALKYMEKSKALLYKDPELHFMMAKFYYNMQQFEQANQCIDECLKIIPSYFPAMKMKEDICAKL